eukprot:CAMPEP_0115326512 /NCGR_PEP_ID=MMETSP0270-20121206/83613_1 /TAXON_ID=71861 /ORGANISM="Scrippsiella trochoidea, Strain CCMP3099" /LENGTH=134 /DNA_ID=CAMNT_0002746825 /DNA_START=8 /DNA_END=412 /DNA_ORIENTATION=+
MTAIMSWRTRLHARKASASPRVMPASSQVWTMCSSFTLKCEKRPKSRSNRGAIKVTICTAHELRTKILTKKPTNFRCFKLSKCCHRACPKIAGITHTLTSTPAIKSLSMLKTKIVCWVALMQLSARNTVDKSEV